MEDNKFVFEVTTYYKSGRTRKEFIGADTEVEMWGIYDSRHRNKSLIESSVIHDCWLQ